MLGIILHWQETDWATKQDILFIRLKPSNLFCRHNLHPQNLSPNFYTCKMNCGCRFVPWAFSMFNQVAKSQQYFGLCPWFNSGSKNTSTNFTLMCFSLISIFLKDTGVYSVSPSTFCLFLPHLRPPLQILTTVLFILVFMLILEAFLCYISFLSIRYLSSIITLCTIHTQTPSQPTIISLPATPVQPDCFVLGSEKIQTAILMEHKNVQTVWL